MPSLFVRMVSGRDDGDGHDGGFEAVEPLGI